MKLGVTYARFSSTVRLFEMSTELGNSAAALSVIEPMEPDLTF